MTIQKPPSNSFEQVRAEQLEYNAKRERAIVNAHYLRYGPDQMHQHAGEAYSP